MRTILIATAWMAILGLVSCSGSDRKDWQREVPAGANNIEYELEVIRLEEQFVGNKTPKQMDLFLMAFPEFSRTYFGPVTDNRPLFIQRSLQFTTATMADTLLAYFQKASKGKIEDTKVTLEQGFKRVKYLYPQLNLPDRLYTIITGFLGSDLYMNERLIGVGLEFGDGSNSEYLPPDEFYSKYILDQMTYERLPYLITFNIIRDAINKYDEKDKTLLAKMIDQGKNFYCLETIYPNAPDSIIIGYSGEEIANAQFNKKIIWEHFLANELFYETKELITRKYVGQRPKVTEIDNDCPGRIGNWLGWQIVRSYMANHPEVTLQQLMAMTDAKQIFQESRFRPEAD